VARRAATQVWLLAAVLAVVVAGCAVLGACTLLLTDGRTAAQHAALLRTPADELGTEVVLSDVVADPGGTVGDVVGVAAGELGRALAPLAASTSTWVTSTVRDLPADAAGDRRLGWLGSVDDLADRAELVSGRWPVGPAAGGPVEAVVPARTAERLGLRLDDEVPLSAGAGTTGAGTPVTVVLVGTVAPVESAWQRDLLDGAGYTPGLTFGVFGRLRLPAYGPFLVAPEVLLGERKSVDRVSLLAAPDVTGAAPADLEDARAGVAALRADLSSALGDRDVAVRVAAALPGTLAAIDREQAVTGSGVLVVALLGTVLAGTALGLAGQLVAGRRAAETALLTARGARPRQLLGQAAAEAGALVVLATAVAVPLALLLYRWLLHLPSVAAGGLSGPAGVPVPLVVTVAVGALVLATILVVPTLRPAGPAVGRRSTRGAVLRSGADLLLLALAAVAVLQLRAHPSVSAAGADPVLVAAPVLVLVAGAVLALRVLPLLARIAEWHARRSRRLVLPLAGWEIARRPHATGAAFLLVLAAAAATFGISFTTTWRASQVEQADATVGSDLAVPVAAQAPLTQGAAVQAATGGTVSAVTTRGVALGSLVRLDGEAPATHLVALDTRRAGELLRGRPPADTSWAGLTRDLAPEEALAGPPVVLPASAPTVTVTGSSDQGVLGARPALLVQDAQGGRTWLTGELAELDGRTHPVGLVDTTGQAPAAPEQLTVVGVRLDVRLLDRGAIDPDVPRAAAVTVEVGLAAGGAAGGGDWAVAEPLVGAQLAGGADARVDLAGGTATVTTRAALSLPDLLLDDAPLLAAAFRPPDAVPVLVSRDLADAVGLVRGDRYDLVVGTTGISAVVAGVVPYVPSVPAGPAVLADADALTRALAAAGDVEPFTDAWWAGDLTDPAAAAVRLAEAGLPGAVTRAELAQQLRTGPLRVGLPVALGLLVAAAVVLALSGTALHVLGALGARAVEVARLQGLGVPRRTVAAALAVQHGAVTSVAVLLGTGLGALAAGVVAPLLTVSPSGAVPVPEPLARWPWPAESLLVVGLLVGSAAVVVPVVVALVRRASAAHLRMDAA